MSGLRKGFTKAHRLLLGLCEAFAAFYDFRRAPQAFDDFRMVLSPWILEELWASSTRRLHEEMIM